MSTEDRRKEAAAAVEATRERVRSRGGRPLAGRAGAQKAGLPSVLGARYSHDKRPSGYVVPPDSSDDEAR